MRIKNKELKQRRHRKEQVIKAAQKALRLQYEGKAASGVTVAPKAKAPAAPKAAKPKTETAEKPKATAEKKPAKKKAEEAPAE